MKSLDAFGRPIQEFQVKTTCGGYLSVCSFCVIAILFLTELRYFMLLETKDEMAIDQNQDQKYLNITLNLTFPAVPCGLLYMNLIDPKKANVMHVAHDIYKTRLSGKKQIGRRIRDSMVNVAQTSAELGDAGFHNSSVRTTHATPHLRCLSCYQSHIDEDDCCSSCADVRQAFKQRNWDDAPKDYVFSQCVSEAYAEAPPQRQEGCRFEAKLHVRKVAATIHLGVGRHFQPEHLYGNLNAEQVKEMLASLDFSHEIHALSFGASFPGLVHVLDGGVKNNHVAGMSEHFQYDIHVIPTRYWEEGSTEIASHQYSVTEYMKTIDQRQRHQDLIAIGVWANYDFTPFEVKVTKSRKPFSHFFTECCAILGGIFAFTGMLDNFAYTLNKHIAKRSSGGKGGSGLQLTSLGPQD